MPCPGRAPMPVRERTGDYHPSRATQGYHNARLRFPHRLNRDQQLGHFPQAFSDLSLIKAAINPDYQLKHGAGLRLVVTCRPDSPRWKPPRPVDRVRRRRQQ